MKVIRGFVEKEINQCYHQCLYFKEEEDGDVMICKHPDAEDKGYIITYPECMTGFPANCPLIKIEDMKIMKNIQLRLQFENLWRNYFCHLPPLDSQNVLVIEKLKEFSWAIYQHGYNFNLGEDFQENQ